MRLVTIDNERQLRAWFDFTTGLYAGTGYIPPIRQVVADVWRQAHKGRKGLARSFHAVLDADDRIVARTTLHSDAALDTRFGERVQLFGFTEFTNSYAVFAFLFERIAAMAAGAGRTQLFGPANFLPNENGGVITSNFEARSSIDATYNHAYYPTFYRRFGFSERFQSETWFCRLPSPGAPSPEELFAFDDARLAREHLQVHRGDRRHLQDQMVLLLPMLNASFAQRDYYTPISWEELSARVDGLDYLLDEDLLLYLSCDDTPVAFALAVPDISPFLARTGGNLNIWNQLRLLATRRRYRASAVLLIKGTVPDAQSKGYMTLLARELYRNLIGNGYEELRTTFVEKSNPASASQLVRMGGEVLHHVVFFARAVAQ